MILISSHKPFPSFIINIYASLTLLISYFFKNIISQPSIVPIKGGKTQRSQTLSNINTPRIIIITGIAIPNIANKTGYTHFRGALNNRKRSAHTNDTIGIIM